MTDKNTPKSFIEWLGYTTTPRFLKARWLGATIGGIAALTIASAVMLSIVQFFIAATGISTSATIHADARNYALILAALLSIPFVIWRVLIAQKLADIAEQGLITDRLNKAVEQLGAEKTIRTRGGEKTVPNLEVRIGAIYTLERLSQDSARDHIMVMEILSAYIRNASEKTTLKLSLNDHSDVEAALSVIGRRSEDRIEFERNPDKNGTQNPYSINLKNIRVRDADFKNARLSHVDFTGATLHAADFDGAQLDHTDFSFAVMKESTFRGARLSNADSPQEGEISSVVFDLTSAYNCDFSECQKCSQASFSGIYGSRGTTLPNGMARPSSWHQRADLDCFDRQWKQAKMKR